VASRTGRQHWNRPALALLIISCAVWTVCGLAFVVVQVSDVLGVCNPLGGSSVIGSGDYQLWPPGRPCVYEPDVLPPMDNNGTPVALAVPVRLEAGLALAMLLAFPVGVASAVALRHTD